MDIICIKFKSIKGTNNIYLICILNLQRKYWEIWVIQDSDIYIVRTKNKKFGNEQVMVNAIFNRDSTLLHVQMYVNMILSIVNFNIYVFSYQIFFRPIHYLTTYDYIKNTCIFWPHSFLLRVFQKFNFMFKYWT